MYFWENIIDISDHVWQDTIFGVIKANKSRNIHATIIDFPILKQNLNLLSDKLLDYSEDRMTDMSVKKFMVNCKPQDDRTTDPYGNPLAAQGKVAF